VPDGPPTPVAASFGGAKQDPKISASAEDGRLEIVWQSVAPSGLGEVDQVALSSTLQPLGPVLPMGDPAFPGSRSRPAVVVLDSRSIVTWQERRDGNWSIFMRVVQSGVI